MPTLTFTAIGTPAAQGSKAYMGLRNGKPVLVEQSKKVAPWRAAVCLQAKAAITANRWQTTNQPVALTVLIRVARPKTVSALKRPYPTVPPDSDKILRSICDALTQAGAWTDDSVVVDHHVYERYADNGTRPGVDIKIETITATPSSSWPL